MTKGEHVAETLRNEILAHKFSAGAKLPSETELCQIFGVSRTSVRTALQMLAAEGVIYTHHGKGSFVNSNYSLKANSPFPFSDIQVSRIDMFEFRRIFEAESAALAASRADDETIGQIRENVEQMQLSDNVESSVRLDMEFHYLIAKATRNAIMPVIYDMLRPAYHKMFYENVARRGNDGYKEHLQILSAIASRNPSQASVFMTQHLNKSMMQSTVESYMRVNSEKNAGVLSPSGQADAMEGPGE